MRGCGESDGCEDRWGELVGVAQFGESLFPGKVFSAEGRVDFEQEGGEVATVKMMGEGFAEDIQGGRKCCAGCRGGSGGTGSREGIGDCGDDGFVVMEGTEDDGIGRKGDLLQYFHRAIDPGVEIGLGAAFEF